MDIRKNLPISRFNQFCWNLISTWVNCVLLSFQQAFQLQWHWAQALVASRRFSISNNIDPTYIQQLRKLIPPPTQYSVGVKNLITLIILYSISCRLVTILKAIDVHIRKPDIFALTVCFRFIQFNCKISPYLILKYLLASRLTLFKLSILLWFVTTAFQLASFDLKIVNILHHTMVQAASVHTDLDSPQLRFSYSLLRFSKPYLCYR